MLTKEEIKEIYWLNPESERKRKRDEYYKMKNDSKGYQEYKRKKREYLKKSYATIGYLRPKRYNLKKRLELIKKFGGRCKKCGIDDIRVLQVDHINGNGEIERKKFNSKTRYKMIMADDGSKYQLLCANCNIIKAWENNEFSGKNNK